LGGWVVKGWMALCRGLGLSFVWMETLADSSRWHYLGCLRASNMMSAKCWD
jgi:hypothetical protein